MLVDTAAQVLESPAPPIQWVGRGCCLLGQQPRWPAFSMWARRPETA